MKPTFILQVYNPEFYKVQGNEPMSILLTRSEYWELAGVEGLDPSFTGTTADATIDKSGDMNITTDYESRTISFTVSLFTPYIDESLKFFSRYLVSGVYAVLRIAENPGLYMKCKISNYEFNRWTNSTEVTINLVAMDRFWHFDNTITQNGTAGFFVLSDAPTKPYITDLQTHSAGANGYTLNKLEIDISQEKFSIANYGQDVNITTETKRLVFSGLNLSVIDTTRFHFELDAEKPACYMFLGSYKYDITPHLSVKDPDQEISSVWDWMLNPGFSYIIATYQLDRASGSLPISSNVFTIETRPKFITYPKDLEDNGDGLVVSSYLTPENVKRGVIILGVKGEYDGTEYPEYTGATTVTPSPLEQTLNTSGKVVNDNITVQAISPIGGEDDISYNATDADLGGTVSEFDLSSKNQKKYIRAFINKTGWYNNQTKAATEIVVQIDDAEKEKIISENIKKDVTILGVTGTLDGTEYPEYTGATEVTPSGSEQTLSTAETVVKSDIKVKAISPIIEDGSNVAMNKTDATTGAPYTTTAVISSKNQTVFYRPKITTEGWYKIADGKTEAQISISASERQKLLAGNIRKGVTILGVEGSYEGTQPDNYTGAYIVIPSLVDQTLQTKNKKATDNIKVNAITPVGTGVSIADSISEAAQGGDQNIIPMPWDVNGKKYIKPQVNLAGWYAKDTQGNTETVVTYPTEITGVLTPANIRYGVDVLGVVGTLEPADQYPEYTGETEITPTAEEQILETENTLVKSNITIKAMEILNTLKRYFDYTACTMQSFFRASYHRWTDAELESIFPTPDTTSSVTDFSHLNSYISNSSVYTTDNLQNITTFPNIDVSKATSIEYMFFNCSNLNNIKIDWSKLPTTVTSAYRTFYGCGALTSIPSLPWEQIKYMAETFRVAGSTDGLGVLELSFDSLLGANRAFNYSKITEVKNFYAPLLEQAEQMFEECTKLTKITGDFYAPNLYDTTGSSANNGFFAGCTSLTTVGESDTPSLWTIKTLYSTFYSCSSLALVNMNIVGTTSFSDMFILAGVAGGICYIRGVSLISDSSCNRMFYASKFSNIRIQNIEIEYAQQMFYSCSNLVTLSDLNLNIYSSSYQTDMFYNCSNLTTLEDSDTAPEGSRWQFKYSVSFSSSPLDKASALKVINGLQTVTSAPTLTLSTTTKGYFTPEELDAVAAICTGKGWTLA